MTMSQRRPRQGRGACSYTVAEPWYSLEHTFVIEPCQARLPTPPVSAKRDTAPEGA